MKVLFLLAVSGALGTLARYGMSRAVTGIFGTGFPYGTLTVNAAGSFLAGFIWFLIETKTHWHESWATLSLVGFLGAFTTFSAVMLESGRFIHGEEPVKAILNILLQNIVGVSAVLLGIFVARLYLK